MKQLHPFRTSREKRINQQLDVLSDYYSIEIREKFFSEEFGPYDKRVEHFPWGIHPVDFMERLHDCIEHKLALSDQERGTNVLEHITRDTERASWLDSVNCELGSGKPPEEQVSISAVPLAIAYTILSREASVSGID